MVRAVLWGDTCYACMGMMGCSVHVQARGCSCCQIYSKHQLAAHMQCTGPASAKLTATNAGDRSAVQNTVAGLEVAKLGLLVCLGTQTPLLE